MYEIDSRLKELEAEGTPIQVALIGAGHIGTDIIAQVECMVWIWRKRDTALPVIRAK